MDIRPGFTRVSAIPSQWHLLGRVNEELLRERSEFGTRMHVHFADYLTCSPMQEMTEVEKLCFQSFLGWFDRMNPEVIAVEKRFYNEPLMVTGCVDAIFRLPHEDKLVIVDWKTTSQPSHITWPLQAAFYMMLAKQDGEFDMGDRAIFVQVDKEGGIAKSYEYIYNQNMINTCVSTLNSYKYLESKGFPFE